jgi:hypothetical protein
VYTLEICLVEVMSVGYVVRVSGVLDFGKRREESMYYVASWVGLLGI